MKRSIGLIVIVLFAYNAFAQNIKQSTVPAVVLNSFQLKHPNAENASWKILKGNYHIKFEVNSKFNSLDMDYKGNVLKFHQDLWGSEVPEKVIHTIKSRVKYFDLNDADLIKEGSELWYEINFKIDGKDHDFWINRKGKLLKYRKELNNNEIPSSIVTLIKEKYGTPGFDRSKYIEEDERIFYIIRCKINGSDHVFTIDNKGIVLKNEQDLRNDEIPVPVMKTLASAYKDFSIRDADLIEEDGEIIYILRIRKSKEQLYVTFNKNGKVLNVK